MEFGMDSDTSSYSPRFFFYLSFDFNQLICLFYKFQENQLQLIRCERSLERWKFEMGLGIR